MRPINVRKLRERLGLSREEMAGKLNVTPRAVRSWEEGARNPHGSALTLLSQLADEVSA